MNFLYEFIFFLYSKFTEALNITFEEFTRQFLNLITKIRTFVFQDSVENSWFLEHLSTFFDFLEKNAKSIVLFDIMLAISYLLGMKYIEIARKNNKDPNNLNDFIDASVVIPNEKKEEIKKVINQLRVRGKNKKKVEKYFEIELVFKQKNQETIEKEEIVKEKEIEKNFKEEILSILDNKEDYFFEKIWKILKVFMNSLYKIISNPYIIKTLAILYGSAMIMIIMAQISIFTRERFFSEEKTENEIKNKLNKNFFFWSP